MKNVYFPLFLLLFFQLSYSQGGLSFKESKQLYLHGNSILIGNNILGNHASKPLMDLSIPNDLVKMKYIDVDNDKSTFSSSEATINNSPKDSKIKYAVLYWSGLYPFGKGVLRRYGDKIIYKGRGIREQNVSSILFKTPNGDYETINGTVIYDSYNSEVFETNKPYVCYADVTSKLQNIPTINGTYTVANIKAATGKISGGGSAGWLLYIIYEDLSQTPKYFNIYNGMVEVSKEDVEIGFTNFKSKEAGNIQATIAIGAMEGDRKITRDQVSVLDKHTGEFIRLGSKVREETNFFNSSITIGDKFFEDRNPNSANTLGFDLLKMQIPNQNNKLFDNTTTQASFKFQGKLDRFYLFFMAFETEIDNSFMSEEMGPIKELLSSNPIDNSDASMGEQALEIKNISSDIQSEVVEKSHSGIQENLENNILRDEAILLEKTIKEEFLAASVISVPGLESGYYLVTNVFSRKRNVANWTQFLDDKNIESDILVNPANRWSYVYIANNESFEAVFEMWKANKDIEFFEGLWIAKVNL